MSLRPPHKPAQAVIVEPREHPALPMVVNNMCEKLPNVPIVIIHGSANKKFVEREVSKIPCVHDILEVNASNLNGQSYSKLLTSPELWKHLQKADKTLIFQTDSGICGPGEDLELFTSYDYCGAPWKWDATRTGGNGGFSIRTSEVALRHSRQHGPDTYNEDMKFVEWCKQDTECRICPFEVGKKFSTETIPSKAWAFHRSAEALCPFDQKIRDIGPVEWKHPVPDVDRWQPMLTPSRIHHP